ncbi:MAG TPA: translation elongation factor Ts [Actinomycetota bacterium]|nr:translation elongation factor Ts [Actinomycetota bacterium]
MSVGESTPGGNVAISADQVKRLRETTGAGMMDCKRALEETGGDLDRAVELLRVKGLADAKKRQSRVAREGVVDAYIHMNGRLGVLVEVNCETDFVADTEAFRTAARDIAMHVAASDPRWISREDVPEDVIEGERKLYAEQGREQGKPDNVIERIVQGKLEAFYKDNCLLDQPFVRDDTKTVGELVSETSGKVGEKVEVRRFARFKLGEEIS